MLRCCRTQQHPSRPAATAGAPARRASSLLAAAAAAAAAVGGGGGCCARPPALQLPAAAAPAVTAAAAARASAAHVRRHGGGSSGSSGSGGPGLGIAAAATPGGAPRDGPLAPAFAAISSGRLLLLQRLRSWSGADRAEKALKEKQQRQQQQQAARVRAKCFRAAAKRVFPLPALRAVPPKPPPLSALPAVPLPADSIPPLLEWVTTARMRPVAVQSILEQHCSPGVRRIVAAAAQLAEAEQEEQPRKGKGGGGGILITSAHLALAALADGDADCAAALGVLHHSAAGLSLRRCAEVLAWRAAQERRWEEETRQYKDIGKGSSSGRSIFSAPALHFLFQSYRWAVFTGCDTVQPCHLLWALAADPRLSYSPLRTDPLDGRVPAAEVREPPLVWLLQQFPQQLPRPAAVYEQMLGVVQPSLQRQVAAPPSTTTAAASAGGGITAGVYGGLNARLSALKFSIVTELRDLGDFAALQKRDVQDLAALLRACRLAGHVPSRKQLQAADSLLSRCVMQPAGPFAVDDFWDGLWPAVLGVVEAFAALGWKRVAPSVDDLNQDRKKGLSEIPAPAAATDVFDRVQALCRAEAALRFFAEEGLAAEDCDVPEPLSEAIAAAAADAPARARALQALLAVADLTADVAWSAAAAGKLLAGPLHSSRADGAPANPEERAVAQQLADEVKLCCPQGNVARFAVCLALQADDRLGARWRDVDPQRACQLQEPVGEVDMDVAAAGLRRAMPLPARMQLLQAVGNRGQPLQSYGLGWLPAALAGSLDLDSSSIHATLGVQRRVAEAYAAAGCGVPEGWLRQLASYGNEMGGGSSKGAAKALQGMLRAAASVTSTSSTRASTSTSSGTVELLCQLAKLLERNAAAGWLSPRATQAVLGHLQALAGAAAGRGGINSLAASCGTATAVLALAATPPEEAAALDPELLSALSDMAGSELPCMVGGEQQQQLAALVAWDKLEQQ